MDPAPIRIKGFASSKVLLHRLGCAQCGVKRLLNPETGQGIKADGSVSDGTP